MEIVYRTPRAEYELTLGVSDPGVEVGELTATLAPHTGPMGLTVDGRWYPDDAVVGDADIVSGSVLELAGAPAPQAPPPVALLQAARGLDAGWAVALVPGSVVVGRDPDVCDVVLASPTVSRRHAEITVDQGGQVQVEALSERSTTRVDDVRVTGRRALKPGSVLALGAVELTIAAPSAAEVLADAHRGVTPAGTVAFNRPPRQRSQVQTETFALPSPPPERQHQPLSIATMLLPLVAAGVMAAALHETTYLLIALLTPVMGFATWVETNRRSKKTAGQWSRDFRQAVATLQSGLTGAREREEAHRRLAHPDLAELAHRATAPTMKLWERRPGDSDFLHLAVGTGDVAWEPPVRGQPSDAVAEVLAQQSTLRRVPVVVEASGGAVLGVVGERAAAEAFIRGYVCQAALLHGPADLAIAVLSDAAHASAWEWIKWLPHADASGVRGWSRLLAATPRAVSDLMGLIEQTQADAGGSARPLLVVVDDEQLATGPDPLSQRVRQLLRGAGGPVLGVVVARSRRQLVNFCTAVVEVDESRPAAVEWPSEARRIERIMPWGMTERTARHVARALAHFSDPETAEVGAGLPDSVPLSSLLGIGDFEPSTVAARWSEHRRQWDAASGRTDGSVPPFGTFIGAGTDGPVFVDLIHDGPHAMVGGMTGSGKSELLSSLITGLAVTISPEDLVFGLFDFKGGAAFRVFDELPHVVGMMSDLAGTRDAGAALAERALTCLQAELMVRKELFQVAGVNDWRAYRARMATSDGSLQPLPRLVVVIDEFASMAEKVPTLFETLDQIAREGRSLGVHLVLATQKPAGVVDADMRANTNLWICLRVQDRGDSTDVIGIPDAVSITRPGRAYVKVGPRTPIPVQTALATSTSAGDHVEPVVLRPFVVASLGLVPAEASPDPDAPTVVDVRDQPDDLERLLDATRKAFAASGSAAPRRPFPDPLPSTLSLSELTALVMQAGSGDLPVLPLGLADDPGRQRRIPFGWDPRRGNLVVVGGAGSGTSSALATVALQVAAGLPATAAYLYVMDFGAGMLSPIAGLPHCGAYIGGTELERQSRLIRYLRSELGRRKEAAGDRETGAAPSIFVLVDGFEALRAELDDAGGLFDVLQRVFAEGPEVGIHSAVSTGRYASIPGTWGGSVQQWVIMGAVDAADLGALGLPRTFAAQLGPSGRAVETASAKLCQLAWPGPSLATAVAAAGGGGARGPAPSVGVLPDEVDARQVAGHLRVEGNDWTIPIGLGDTSLGPVALRLYEGEHALIGGPTRSGKSTALRAIAWMVHRGVQGVRIIGVGTRRSGLRDCDDLDAYLVDDATTEALTAAANSGDPLLVLVDDAERLDEVAGRAVEQLLALRQPTTHVVAAGRPDFLRGLYGHWTQTVRKSRAGVLLRPDVDLDGDLLGVSLPRRVTVRPVPGRGFLVDNGDVELIQTMWPEPDRR